MDYEPIETFLIGECGMTEREAGFTTLREFNIKVKAKREAEQAKWERARWQMFIALQMQPFIKPHSKPKTAQSWIQFPWERVVKEVSKEDCRVTENEVEQLNILLQKFKDRRMN